MVGSQVDQLALLHFRSLLDIALVLWCEGELLLYRFELALARKYNGAREIDMHTESIARTERVLSDCVKRLHARNALVSTT